jgi:hypothetical protein
MKGKDAIALGDEILDFYHKQGWGAPERICLIEARNGILAGITVGGDFPDGWYWTLDGDARAAILHGPFPDAETARQRALVGRERALFVVCGAS